MRSPAWESKPHCPPLSVLLSACQPAATPTATAPVAPTAEPVTLKIALLPIIDTLPMYVADQEGLFTKHGVQVEFISVGAAPERDQLIPADQADGMINETISTFFFNQDSTQVQIGVSLSAPIYEGGRIRAQTRQAQAQALASRHSLEALQDQVNLDTESAFLTLQDSVAKLQAARHALESFRVSMQATRKSYDIASIRIC